MSLLRKLVPCTTSIHILDTSRWELSGSQSHTALLWPPAHLSLFKLPVVSRGMYLLNVHSTTMQDIYIIRRKTLGNSRMYWDNFARFSHLNGASSSRCTTATKRKVRREKLLRMYSCCSTYLENYNVLG